jgi:hypothetical protein
VRQELNRIAMVYSEYSSFTKVPSLCTSPITSFGSHRFKILNYVQSKPFSNFFSLPFPSLPFPSSTIQPDPIPYPPLSLPPNYLQLVLTVVLPTQLGTVKLLFGSLSHVTVPELSTLINLNVKLVPGAIFTVAAHSGLALV